MRATINRAGEWGNSWNEEVFHSNIFVTSQIFSWLLTILFASEEINRSMLDGNQNSAMWWIPEALIDQALYRLHATVEF